MGTDTKFQTNYEGGIVIEELADATDCSVEDPFAADAPKPLLGLDPDADTLRTCQYRLALRISYD